MFFFICIIKCKNLILLLLLSDLIYSHVVAALGSLCNLHTERYTNYVPLLLALYTG